LIYQKMYFLYLWIDMLCLEMVIKNESYQNDENNIW
jgi:hypothetical protein